MKSLESISGRSNGVEVTLRGMPVETGPNGKTTFVDPEFGPFLIDQIFERQLVFATKKGWLRTQQHCRQCGEQLETTADSSLHSFEFDLTFKTFPRFRLSIDLPAIKCGSCGAANAIQTRDMSGDIPDALTDAFQSASISRS